MGRKILGALAGLVAGGVTVFLVQMLGHRLIPPPAGMKEAMEAGDRARMGELIAQMPFAGFAMVLLAYLLGTFVAAFVAAKIGKDGRLAWLLGGIQTAFILANTILIPHPAWFLVAAVVVAALATVVAFKLATCQPAPPA